MNILIIGSGGREHTFAWKLAQSPRCSRLFVAPGNAGTATLATNLPISITDFAQLAAAIRQYAIELLVVGPEQPLVDGVRDYMEAQSDLKNLRIVGPGRIGAQLEGSKDFSKQFMLRHQIPTAEARTFDLSQLNEGLDYLAQTAAPYVIKADGLAAGKGVIISPTLVEAQAAFRTMLSERKFGQASDKVVVEQFLSGVELSVFVLTDGQSYKILPEAKDYKRIGEGDTGPNTGGMGAVSPVAFAQGDFLLRVEDRVVKPTLAGLQADGIDYKGFIFIGLMNVDGDPYVIEYNARMGDPETEVVLPRLESDLVDLLLACAEGTLSKQELRISPETAATVVMVAGGYPEAYDKGHIISGLPDANHSLVFHAGTLEEHGEVRTHGGRVLALTSMAPNLAQALERCYQSTGRITWSGAYYRRDIGQDLRKLGQP
ncbi:MAG: phosphoribosylamine--glycine ligase [Cytophagales bacterium]|nr:phosphoribosylamine--glycine ligase [Cytophagales bacterium]